MAGRSSISRNPKAKAAADRTIAEGGTVDDVADAVAPFGVSRSAAGRYVKRYRPMVEDFIAVKAVMAAAREHFPEGEGSLIDLALHKATIQTLRTLAEMESAEEAPSVKQLGELNRAVRTTAAALREKAAHDRLVRERARQEAATEAEKAARDAGASDVAIETIKRRILGLT